MQRPLLLGISLTALLACGGRRSTDSGIADAASLERALSSAADQVEGERWIEEYEGADLRRRGREVLSQEGDWIPDGPWVESETLEDFYSVFGIERQEGSYVLGQRSGTWRAFDEEGRLSWEGAYRRGEREGIWTWYHANGQPQKSGLFREGLEEGPWKWWHPDGAPERSGRFEAGLDQGPWIFWHANGAVAKEGLYEDGAAIGEWKLYHPNGRLSEVGLFVPEPEVEGLLNLHDTGLRSSVRQGVWKRWDENGRALEPVDYGTAD